MLASLNTGLTWRTWNLHHSGRIHICHHSAGYFCSLFWSLQSPSVWLSYIGKIMTVMVVEDYKYSDLFSFFFFQRHCAGWLFEATMVHIPKSHKMWLKKDKQSWCSFLSPCVFSSLPSPLCYTSPHSWEPELERGIWEEARPIISWPHSRWLDSWRPRPVVSIGRAQDAMAANRQQQQYTERVRYTEDSNITYMDKQKWSSSCVFFFLLTKLIGRNW